MGRFYKTNQTAPIDWIERNPNIQLMAMAIANQDANIDNQINEAKLLGSDLAKTPYLEKDRDLATGKINQLNEKVTNLTNGIMKDPAKWREKLGELRDLKNEIHKEYTTGVLGNVGKNYNTAQQKFKELDERVAKGKVNAEDANRWKALYMQKYEGAYDPKTNTYKPFNWDDITDDFDQNKFLDEAIKGIVPDAQDIKRDKNTGAYIVTTEHGIKTISKEEVYNTLQNAVAGNKDALQFYKQRQMIGTVDNVLDENGNLRETFGYKLLPKLDDNGQPIIDPVTKQPIVDRHLLPLVDNILARNIASHMAKDAYSDIKDFQTMDENKIWMQNDQQAATAKLQSQRLAHAEKMQKRDQDFKIEFERLKEANKPNTTEFIRDDDGNVLKEYKYNSSGINGDNQKKVTLGPTGEIQVYRDQFKNTTEFNKAVGAIGKTITDLNNSLQDPTLTPSQKIKLQNDLVKAQGEQYNLKNILSDVLLNKDKIGLEQNVIDKALHYSHNKTSLEQDLNKARYEYNQAMGLARNIGGEKELKYFYEKQNNYNKKLSEFKSYETAYAKLSKAQNNTLSTYVDNKKENMITAPATDKMKEGFLESLKYNPAEMYSLKDPDKGSAIDKNFKDLRQLQEHLKTKGLDLSNYIEYESMGVDGSVLKIKEDIPGTSIKKDKKVIVDLPQGVRNFLANSVDLDNSSKEYRAVIEANRNSSIYSLQEQLNDKFRVTNEHTPGTKGIKQKIFHVNPETGQPLTLSIEEQYSGNGEPFYNVYSENGVNLGMFKSTSEINKAIHGIK